jgi:putative membrane protein
MRFVLTTSALILLALPSAEAQTGQPGAPGLSKGNPGFTAPGPLQNESGAPTPHRANQADRVFVLQASVGGLAEVEFARLAEQRAQAEPLREFARRMLRDHGKSNEDLAKLAQADGLPLSGELDAEHAQVREGLSSLSGPEFEIEYLRSQVQDHQRTIQLLEYEIGSGEEGALQQFAVTTLPVVFKHLQMARDMLADASARNPRVAAAPPRTVSGMPAPQTPRANEH